MKTSKSLSLTYLTQASFASLNGSDKEADNMSNIKKISIGTEQFPYVSSQAVRRALRNQIEMAVGIDNMSEGVVATIAKGAGTTKQLPSKYIDDDLFGYMGTSAADAENKTKGDANIRTSPIRVSPLIALTPYQADLDFGTNMTAVKNGGNPNIFETEIHSGLYRGTILVELDRIGMGKEFKKDFNIDNKLKAERVKILINALKNLWSSGRQTRFLSDISPKFVAAAMLKTKNPIFLETVIVDGKKVNSVAIKETLNDYKNEIVTSVIGVNKNILEYVGDSKTIGESFEDINKWIDLYYQ